MLGYKKGGFALNQWLCAPRSRQDGFLGKRRLVVVALSVLILSASAGCNTVNGPSGSNVIRETFASDDPCSHNSRNIGLLIGAIGGAVIGNRIADNGNRAAGTAIGLGLGAALGGFIGNDMDQRRCELSRIAKANNLDMTIVDIKQLPSADGTRLPNSAGQLETVGMSVTVTEKIKQFASGSASPTAQGTKIFAEIAEQYRSKVEVGTSAQDKTTAVLRNKNIRILLVGHTDDTGSSQFNADLSEQRARAVAHIFAENGFSPNQIFFQGAGETLPIADNRDEEGRAKNRRVEIVDLADEQAFAAFLANRRPNLAFYRPVEAHIASSGQSQEASLAATSPVHGKVAKAKSSRVTPTPSSTSRAIASTESTKHISIDFGGGPVVGHFAQIDIGKPVKSDSFSLVSSAYASTVAPVGSCAQDRPRVGHGVKSLSSGKEISYATSDYLPGVYGSSWAGDINGHLVALTNVSVLRDGAVPASRPTLLIYRDYKPDRNAKSSFKANPAVNSYLGDRALLYRVFVNDGPVGCIDMVIPNGKPTTAPGSNLVYLQQGKPYQAGYSPHIAR